MLALSSVYYPPSLKYWKKRTLIFSASLFSLPTKSVHYLLFFKTYAVPFQGIWERSPQTSNSPYGQPPLLLQGTPPPLTVLYLKLFHLYDKQEDNQNLLSSNQENAFCGQKPF